MEIEILLGGLVGLSFIAALIYLLTRQESPSNRAADSPPAGKVRSDEEGSGKNDRE